MLRLCDAVPGEAYIDVDSCEGCQPCFTKANGLQTDLLRLARSLGVSHPETRIARSNDKGTDQISLAGR